jgi:hypothetical protein
MKDDNVSARRLVQVCTDDDNNVLCTVDDNDMCIGAQTMMRRTQVHE